MNRILITGGCGFIGLNLIAYLMKKPVSDIVVLDNLSTGRKENLHEFDVEFHEGDIRDATLVEKLISSVDSVIHLAADTRVMESIENPDYNFDVNVVGTYNLLRAARNKGIERFVFASTGGAILGDIDPPVHEGIVPRPISPYGASKLFAEGYCSAFAGSYDMRTVALRFSNVYGPRSYHKGSVVAAFYKRIINGLPLIVYGDGTQTRDYVYVDDICEAIYLSLSGEHGGKVYQLGSGKETSINELIKEIKEVVGKDYNVDVQYESFRKGEIRKNYADISNAKRTLGFDSKVKLKDGLRRTWEWFCTNYHRYAETERQH
ncbi:MAG TPA: NAD-dependent epimerase/dehydratase family protein [Nitrospirae bacterium]|nr:NAD-dependent epimerase/dehydratase family protein [Nitrospirota bacterium]